MNVVFSVLNPSVKLWPHVAEHPVQTWDKNFKNASSYMENIKMRGTSGQFVRGRTYFLSDISFSKRSNENLLHTRASDYNRTLSVAINRKCQCHDN